MQIRIPNADNGTGLVSASISIKSIENKHIFISVMTNFALTYHY